MAIVGGLAALLYVRRSARLSEMQADFVAHVSHELRTPLAGINLMAETLALGRADEPVDRVRVISRLQFEIARLEELVERILRWRRVEEEGGRVEVRPIELAAVVEEVLDRFGRTDAGANLTSSIDPNLPIVVGDRASLVDAVGNLVHNALKFGGAEAPVDVVARHVGEEVIVVVRDQGPGIPAREHARVVERFYRSPLHRRSHQGAGLGLAIVHRIVRDHGGRLQLESEPGIGSTFAIHLPVASARAIAACGEV